jgi:hypothetical protein
VDARHVVRERAGRDDPADAPGDHALLERGSADGHGAIAHARERGGVPNAAAVEQHTLEARPVQQPQVALPAGGGDRMPLLVSCDPARRERRAVDEDDARAGAARGLERSEIEAPFTARNAQRRELRGRADQAHAVEHAGAGRIREDHLVPGIGQAEEGVQHRVALAARDHDLPAPVVARAPAALDRGGHGVLEIVAAAEN